MESGRGGGWRKFVRDLDGLSDAIEELRAAVDELRTQEKIQKAVTTALKEYEEEKGRDDSVHFSRRKEIIALVIAFVLMVVGVTNLVLGAIGNGL